MNAMRREVEKYKDKWKSRAEKYIIYNLLHVCNSSYALQKDKKDELEH